MCDAFEDFIEKRVKKIESRGNELDIAFEDESRMIIYPLSCIDDNNELLPAQLMIYLRDRDNKEEAIHIGVEDV
jgi:hypothetical protein